MWRQSAIVRLLPNHWWASSCTTSRSWVRRPSRWFDPKIDMPWASIGVVQRVVGDDELVVAERVGPEAALQGRHDRGVPAEVAHGVLAQPGREQRHLARADPDLVVAADLHADQVGRRGLRPLEHPGAGACRAAPRGEHPGGGDGVGRLGGDRDPVRRLVRGVVVAREPGGRAGRLARDERAVGELLPTEAAPRAGHRCGVAEVAHLDGEAARDRPGRRDVQLPARAGELGRSAVDAHPRHAERRRGRG